MTAKTATVRLYVALAALLTAVLRLVAALVRLAASLAVWAAARVEARVAAPAKAPAAPGASPAARLALVPRVETVGPSVASQRLTTALTGLGYKAPAVRAFVDGLGDRVEKEPIEGLIKDGLRALTRAA